KSRSSITAIVGARWVQSRLKLLAADCGKPVNGRCNRRRCQEKTGSTHRSTQPVNCGTTVRGRGNERTARCAALPAARDHVGTGQLGPRTVIRVNANTLP